VQSNNLYLYKNDQYNNYEIYNNNNNEIYNNNNNDIYKVLINHLHIDFIYLKLSVIYSSCIFCIYLFSYSESITTVCVCVNSCIRNS